MKPEDEYDSKKARDDLIKDKIDALGSDRLKSLVFNIASLLSDVWEEDSQSKMIDPNCECRFYHENVIEEVAYYLHKDGLIKLDEPETK